MPDYEETYAAYYDSRATGLEGDVDFYVQAAQAAGGPVLELGCGTGRLLIPSARAGVEMVGLDLSAPMLAVARRKTAALDAAERRRIRLVRGDMRRFAFGQRFALITIPYRAFLHLLTPDDQRLALACVREHLADGGRLILNIFDPRLETLAARMAPGGSAPAREGEFVRPETGRRCVVWSTVRVDPGQQVLHQYFIIDELDPAGRVAERTYTPLTLRYCLRQEMQHLLELCGFQVEALYGDFNREPFRYGGEQIWVARPA